MSDNDEKRRMLETCTIQGKHILNPIIHFYMTRGLKE